MSEPAPEIVVTRCTSCHSRYLPRPGPCPRCGATTVAALRIPPEGRVLAATESMYPPSGWAKPHRLALVTAAEDVRILALVRGDLPETGAWVTIRREGDHYIVELREPTAPPRAVPQP